MDANNLLVSFLIGLIGAGLFMYGRRQGRFPHMVVGAALVIYPYFVSSIAIMAAIAVGLVAMLWAVVAMGLL